MCIHIFICMCLMHPPAFVDACCQPNSGHDHIASLREYLIDGNPVLFIVTPIWLDHFRMRWLFRIECAVS